MDPEPASVSKPSASGELSLLPSPISSLEGVDDEDHLSLSGPSLAFFGFAIAIVTLGVPMAVVFTERPWGQENLLPTTLERDGPKTTLPISFTRVGESSR